MALGINTNIASLIAQRNLTTSGDKLSIAVQRLSSGLRINSAKDDAAGLGISERMSSQIRGLDQAARNANDGVSLAQTGEGALAEISNNLQRIRELAVQAANSTNSASDRAALDAEVQQRIAEIDRTASTASFNNQKILDGNFGTATFQVGANVGETIGVGLSTSMRTTAIGKTADYVGGAAYNSSLAVGQQGAGVSSDDAAAPTAFVAGDLTIAIGSGSAVSVGASTAGSALGQSAGSAYAKAAAINAAGVGGLTVTADTTVQLNMATTAVAATVTDFDLSINTVAIYSNYDASTSGTLSADNIVAAINANSSATGVVASYDSSNTRVTLTASDGRDVRVTQQSTFAAGAAGGFGVIEGSNNSSNNNTMVGATTVVVDNYYTGSIRLSAAEQIVINGGTPSKAGFTATSLALGNSALNSASVTTVANANTTITKIDAAINSVNTLRGTFGSVQNRFGSVVASLMSMSENLSAARSRILDADFATETANLTKASIAQQAGVAMLAQANALPQQVLALLRG